MLPRTTQDAITSQELERILGIAFLLLIAPPLLYIFRFADNNTFTSWRWVFSGTDIVQVYFFLLPAVLCAYALSRLSFSGLRACTALLIVSFVSIIPLWQESEAIIDATRYFVQAKSLKEYGMRYFLGQWGNAINAWTDMPLIPFLYGLIFAGIGEARPYIQLFNTILFSLTAMLTVLIGKKIWGEETGLHAGLLLLGMPYLLTQVPLMLVDVPTMFFLTLAIYAFLRVVEKGGLPWTAAAALALCMAAFSKYSTWLMLSVIPVISLIFARREPKKIFGRTAAVLFLAGIIAGTVILVRYDLFRDQIMLLRTYQWAGLSRWQESFVSTFLFQTHPLVTIFAACGIYRAVREKDSRFLIAGWFAVFVVLLQLKRIRYIIPLLPLFGLMAAYGLHLIKDSRVRRFVVLGIAASSLVIAYGAYLPFLNRTGMANLQHAGRFLNTLNCDPVEVYALPQKSSSGSTFAVIPLLDYYTDRKVISPQEWPGHPQGGKTQKSSLRFTWETEKPDLYIQTEAGAGCALVVISSEVLEGVPEDFAVGGLPFPRELKRFDLSSEVFKYQTFVTVYGKE